MLLSTRLTLTHKMKKRIASWLLYVLFLHLFPVMLPTAHSQEFDSRDLLDFADSLFQEGDYVNAAHEFRRYLFLYPKLEDGDSVQFRLAASYQNAGELEAAIQNYQTLIDTHRHSGLIARAQSNIAQCQLLRGRKDAGIASLQQFLSDYPESELAPRAQFMIATVYMDSKNWEGACSACEQVIIKYPNTPFAKMSDRLIRLVRDGKSMPYHSPTFTGLLSAAIPGLGQAYSGRFSDGLQSLMVVGLTATGSAHYIDQERYNIAIPISLLGLFFYVGNIYGGVQAAKSFNRQQEDNFLDGLRTQIYESGLFGASQPPSTNISFVLWRTRF